MEAETLKAKRMFILDQLKKETDPTKRATILLDCPYYYFVAHKLDIRENLQKIGSSLEQDYFTAVTSYLTATRKHRDEMQFLVKLKRIALDEFARENGDQS